MPADPAILEAVYNAKNHEELMETYGKWAKGYDKDLKEFGYAAPSVCGDALARRLDETSARILDAGCGTGLVGQDLHARGFTNLHALDYSADMLEQVAQKNIYHSLIRADMSRPLLMEDDGYDAVTCVGTFTYGHVRPNALSELARITKPGGLVCFTVREGAYEDHGYRRAMLGLETSGIWEMLEMRDADYISGENVSCKLCVFRIRAQEGNA